MTVTRRGFLAGAGALLATPARSAAATDLLQIEGPAFGAGWRVRVGAGAGVTPGAGAIVAAITGVIETTDAAMSPFRDGSEISVFNRSRTTDWLPLSALTLGTIATAQSVAARTRGAFDPTLGGLVGRYGFGPIRGRPAGAFRDLALRAGGARKAHPRQTLDLCGIAKGQALDRCADALRSIGLEAFFIEMGGEVLARGARPDGSPWRAAVERPLPGRAEPQRVVALRDEALATSGDLINSYVLAGHRYGHIIDPRRMAPADSALASVSVFAPRAVTADALATALFALGPDRGPALAEHAGIDALFLSRDGPDLREVATGRFRDRIIWR